MQGSLFSTFSKITSYKDIDTMNEFFATDLPVYNGLLNVFLDSNRTRALQSRGVPYVKSWNNAKIMYNSVMKMIVDHKNASWLTRKFYVELEIERRYNSLQPNRSDAKSTYRELELIVNPCICLNVPT